MNKRSRLLTVLALIAVLQTVAAQPYRVEPGVKGNTITLEVANQGGSSLSRLEARITSVPSWITIRNQSLSATELGNDATAIFRATFDVGANCKAGDVGDVKIVVLSRGSQVMSKSLSLKIAVPDIYALNQNYPNPFNPTTTINYQLPTASRVSLKVFDVLGREVATLVNEEQAAGYFETKFDASSNASGMYFYRLEARALDGTNAFQHVRKLMVVR